MKLINKKQPVSVEIASGSWYNTCMNKEAIVMLRKHSMFTALLLLVSLLTYICMEPLAIRAQEDTSTFTINQTITQESSFLVEPTDVTMSGTIPGLTGGTALGSTQFVVLSNNATGYYVDIAYEDNGTEQAMLGHITNSEAIRDYGGDVAGEPSFGFTASTSAQFAYSVTSSTTADTDQSFRHNGATCNTGSNDTVNTCWKEPTVSAFRIVDRSTAAVNGATSTVEFRVTVPSGAVPVPTAEPYTATATISLYVQ